MLIYDQALDPYHTAVRLMAILSAATQRSVPLSVDAARIADYFLVYPSKMGDFTFPAEFRNIRSAVKESGNPYRNAPGMRAAFERMRPIFSAALSGLIAAGYVNEDAFISGFIQPSDATIPDGLQAAIDRFKTRQTSVGKFILSDLLDMPANGDKGLKHRSRLIEYRYDLV
ncbi:ABC-three component system middle component 5 [Herbaspirillum sp.]|uniref:ABC-three component system middle component 5 n=1 Tax=Herbaspirillum sp. TaxID=1890675 RepID=UPI0031D3EA05